MRRARPAAWWQDRQGAALVEFTITLPVLLVLFALVWEIGTVLREHQLASAGIRDATRYLSRVPDPDAADAVTAARNLALTSSLDGGLPTRSAFWTDPASVDVTVTEIDNSGGNFRGPATLRLITVTTTVTVDVPLVGPFLSLFGGEAAPSIDLDLVDQARHFGT